MSKDCGYPFRVYAHTSYRRKLGLERLLEAYPDLMVVRKVNGNPNLVISRGESGEPIVTMTVFNCNMANLSLNLAGGLFNVDSSSDLRYLPVKPEAILPWNGEEPSKALCDEYNFAAECFGLCILVRDIHRRTFPFLRHFDNQGARDEYAEHLESVTSLELRKMNAYLVGVFDSKVKKAEVRPRIKVHHSPTMANYWHMTLDTYRPEDNTYVHPEEKLSSTDKKMFVSLKQDIVNHCKVNEKPNYKLKRKDYKKPYTKKDCLFDAMGL